jgi:hypothetical protein
MNSDEGAMATGRAVAWATCWSSMDCWTILTPQEGVAIDAVHDTGLVGRGSIGDGDKRSCNGLNAN